MFCCTQWAFRKAERILSVYFDDLAKKISPHSLTIIQVTRGAVDHPTNFGRTVFQLLGRMGRRSVNRDQSWFRSRFEYYRNESKGHFDRHRPTEASGYFPICRNKNGNQNHHCDIRQFAESVIHYINLGRFHSILKNNHVKIRKEFDDVKNSPAAPSTSICGKLDGHLPLCQALLTYKYSYFNLDADRSYQSWIPNYKSEVTVDFPRRESYRELGHCPRIVLDWLIDGRFSTMELRWTDGRWRLVNEANNDKVYILDISEKYVVIGYDPQSASLFSPVPDEISVSGLRGATVSVRVNPHRLSLEASKPEDWGFLESPAGRLFCIRYEIKSEFHMDVSRYVREYLGAQLHVDKWSSRTPSDHVG